MEQDLNQILSFLCDVHCTYLDFTSISSRLIELFSESEIDFCVLESGFRLDGEFIVVDDDDLLWFGGVSQLTGHQTNT